MAIVKANPTSAGRRFVVKVVTPELYKGRPHEPLVAPKSKSGGRNNLGRITTRHRGGGHKQRYRIIDFKRNKPRVPAVVERLEYDPNRSAHIALIRYADGERSYVIAPRGLKVNDQIVSGSDSPISVGNCLPLRNVPLGTVVHCVELKPGKGAQLARAAGSSLGKAGATRGRGKRPTVRGVAMNPVDHPHGGGEGRTSGGRHPVSPWGVPTKGHKTRTNKSTDQMIVRHRNRK